MKKKIVKITNCQNIFKFGDGRKVKSLQKVLIPAKIGAKHLVSVIKGNKENCTKITCTISSFLLARFIEEILQNIKLDIKCFIDSNGPYIYIYIYDAVNTTNIRDKQLRIEMTVKKEMVEKD